jgi:hypothetical protein
VVVIVGVCDASRSLGFLISVSRELEALDASSSSFSPTMLVVLLSMTVFLFVVWDDWVALAVIGIIDVFVMCRLSNLGRFGGENSVLEGVE